MDKQQIIEAIEQMNVLELADLVKALEEKFGVSAAAAVVAAGPAAGPAAARRRADRIHRCSEERRCSED